ncbi:MAG: DUF4160 domain-containing protein [Treponemataceae bacterium]|nr:DUF4160 domain-containing protein [Treponemataceae bacterium]
MPHIFKIGAYLVFIWINEGEPPEPVHIHVSERRPAKNTTKIWITRSGKCLLAHNDSRIPTVALKNIMRIIETRSAEIISRWESLFGEARFYC